MKFSGLAPERKMVEPRYLRWKWKIVDRHEPCVQNMLDSIDADVTKFNYLYGVEQYCKYLKVSKVADILSGSPEEIEDNIIRYIRFLKSDGTPATTIRSAKIAPLRKFYKNNRKNLNWDYILEKIGKTVKISKDVAYTREQIKTMLMGANERDSVIILAFASTGIRLGALPLLTFGDLTPILTPIEEWGIYMISVYTGQPEQYVTYCTPEFRYAVEKYRAYRERLGEKIIPSSPLVRRQWNTRNRQDASTPLPMNEDSIFDAVHARAVLTGVRSPHKELAPSDDNNHKLDDGGGMVARSPSKNRYRHKNKLVHGMRKYFEVTLLDAGFDEKWLDMIEGHKLTGLRDNYYRPAKPDETILRGTMTQDGRNHKPGFLELMGELIISDESRLERRVKVLEGENNRLDKLEGKVNRDHDIVAKMLEVLPNIPAEQRKVMLELAFDQGAVQRKKQV